jgi:UDP-N-acetylglucosamine--dolichyl-phosphate N-acetylglucosaminephosphotransferase
MLFALVFITSFLATVLITPVFIKKLMSSGIYGRDVHKEKKTKVPEMGGLAVLFGFSAGMFVSIPHFIGSMAYIFAAFLTVAIMGVIGICDDLFGLGQKVKSWLPVFASIPLIATWAGVHTMSIPLIGAVDFGLFYPIILIPVAVTVVSNSFNMMAGYNGMEAGLGFIACLFLGAAGIATGSAEASIILFAMAGACLAFLAYNSYPSRIFPGDTGTFVIGAAVASAVIIGNMEMLGIIVLMPLLANGLITSLGIIRGKPVKKFSEVKNGMLVPPSGEHVNTLYFMLERAFKPTEKKLVSMVWTLGIIFGLVSLLFLFI